MLRNQEPGTRNQEPVDTNRKESKVLRVAVISPIAWRTPPRNYGPWEKIVSMIVEGLAAKGIDVTLFATQDSITSAKLVGVCESPYEENKDMDAKVWECLHISEAMEMANQFDIIHNNYDFLPLTYSKLIKTPMITTIHGFSSPKIIPVYKKYNKNTHYISISNSDRSPELEYLDTVYHGIEVEKFTFNQDADDYLLYLGRIHHDKGTVEAIEVAKKSGKKLLIAGLIQDQLYYEKMVKPLIDDKQIVYVGCVSEVEKSQLLSKAYAFLHPINFEEPFGLTVVEAMASGTPVLTFSKGSMPELIQNGVNGYITRDIDDMAQKVNDIEKVSRKECRRVAEERFSNNRMVSDYIKVYNKILNTL